jgi:hypothetical protein
MTAWIGIIGVIIGGVLTMLGTQMQLRRQIQRDRQKLLLSKLEELHEVLSLFRQSYKGAYLEALSSVHDFKLPEGVESAPVPIERLQMLTGFYATELSEYLQKIETCRKEYGGILIKCARSSKLDEEAREHTLTALSTQQSELQNACSDMQAAVVSLPKKYL